MFATIPSEFGGGLRQRPSGVDVGEATNDCHLWTGKKTDRQTDRQVSGSLPMGMGREKRRARRGRSGVGLCVPVLCVLWGVAWAQNSQPGAVNIASGRPESSYTQSSNYSPSRPSSNGANGKTNGDYSSSNCIHTANQYYDESGRRYRYDRNPWWQVDLGRPYYIYHFKIWGRNGQISRLYPFTIRVDDTECVTVSKSPGRRDITVNCSRPLHGQVVRLTRRYTGSWDYLLNMCEFQILVCDPGYYGMDCNQRCHQHCSSEGCYMDDGKCITCKPGWYGDDCSKPCPSPHCKDEECDQSTGVCLACPGNMVGDNCTECNPGSYGDTCQQSCSTKTPGCDVCKRDGTCTACYDNFEVPDCTVCREGYYKSSSGQCQLCRCASLGCDPETGKCNGCPDRRYGDRCTRNCPSGCLKCDQDSGQCTKCDNNRSPPDCDECLDGYYDKRSLRRCSPCTGTCLNGTFCDKTTGHCPACPPGKRGTTCQYDCERGKYGLNCSLRCGRCQDYTCDPEDGSCARCQAGWQLPLCQEECENGTYGVGCQKSCGHCLAGAACSKVHGACQGCDPGWYPPSCQQECNDGLYGPNCQQRCGTCLNNAICNKANGHCPCPVGKQPPFCDKDCQNSTYGKDCQHKCGHCKEGSVCDPVSGHCPHGCQPGWIDPAGLSLHLCSTECPAGLYGDQCNQTCGHCHSSSSCHHVTGQCLQGCAEGFTGTHCMEVAKDEGLNMGIIIGIVAAVLFILLIVIVILIVLKVKGGRKPKGYRDVSGEMSHSREGLTDPGDPSILSTTSLSLPPPDSADAGRLTTKPQAQVKPTVKAKANQPAKANGAIYENVGILKSKPAVSSSPSPAMGRRDKDTSGGAGKGENRTSGDGSVQEVFTDDEADFEVDEAVYANEHTGQDDPPTSIPLDRLQEMVLDKLRRGQLDEEFLRILPKKDYPVTNGKRQDNYYKNRFNSILPYDKSRVELAQVDGDEASDYINASFVKGHTTDKDYIAAQGPKVNTQDDWWRMVWQEGVTDIVMLTNVMEGVKNKCHQYWPAVGAVLNTGHMVVTGVEESQRAHFVIREFDVKPAEGSDRRRVKQYHYLSWMDHEVPATTPLVNFWRYVTSRAPRAVSAPPLLVHCSAGVGRTGTFIALDIVIARAQENTEVDIYKVVDALRDDRCHMVQNKGQYAFLHEAVLEAYLSEGTRVLADQLDLLFPHSVRHDRPNPRIDAEFQKLCKMRNSLTTPSYTNATQKENLVKNRNSQALPDDKHLVFLTQHVKGRNQYINAVYMPTFFQARGCISTQLPLPDTLMDIWRLIDGCDISTVVSLGDVQGQGNMCGYWPRLGEQLQTGQYTISVQSQAQIGTEVDSYILIMHKEKPNGEHREVRVLHLRGWREKGEESTSNLTHLLDILCNSDTPTSKPVLVQCIDGAADSGQFCALWEVMHRLKSDGEVDVYMAARQVTTISPQAFSAVEEYRYCYEVVQNYRASHSIYANT